MQIIGITGAINHGKTSFSDAFIGLVPGYLQLESGLLVAELANAWQAGQKAIPSPTNLKAINDWLMQLAPLVKNILEVDCKPQQLIITNLDIKSKPLSFVKFFNYLDAVAMRPNLADSDITPSNKSDYRPLLQWLGGFLVERVGGDVWYNQLVKRAQADPNIELCSIGGVRYPSDAAVIKNANGIIVKIVRPQMEEEDLQDPTEEMRNQIKPDVTIFNDGNLEQLQATAKAFYEDLLSRSRKMEYRATSSGS